MMDNYENWFPFNKAGEAGRDTVLVFCFHHAGGTASGYRKWQELNDDALEFVPVELPGKGCRMDEGYIADMQALTEMAAEAVERFAEGRRFVFYGHSMGSAVAFRTAYELEKYHSCKPEVLIVSGRHSPCIHMTDRYTTDMDDEALINELTVMGGTPKEILENRELMEYLIPHIKNDYRLNESFTYSGETVSIPIFAYAGTMDADATYDMMDEWEKVTSCGLKKREFEGNHFFLFDLGRPYVSMLKKRICAALSKVSLHP
ncbi:alpha/beta fold hydrolase [Ruminococcus sp.]|uniref:thioesterase II family protein n=1 Tax=Ruminococcus sp. TaxID=41978 RepID=UPI002BC0DE1F|nr:alpha/beta fold hydrolase [Ruminococcus sp.]HNZ98843.1 alpha/beta fold hydrolase [Ruminococcus sp.]HOH86262.1 alpha/beta fold hydrolase [Ruminococcus sp.]